MFNAYSGQIQGIRVTNSVDKIKSIMLVVELPVKDGHIRIIAGGNEQREEELNRLFEGILLSFESEDNPQRQYLKYGLVLLVLFLAFIVRKILTNKL